MRMDSGGGIDLPRVHRLNHRDLDHVFDQVNSVHAKGTSQHSDKLGRLVPKEVFDQLVGGLVHLLGISTFASSRTSTVPPDTAIIDFRLLFDYPTRCVARLIWSVNSRSRFLKTPRVRT